MVTKEGTYFGWDPLMGTLNEPLHKDSRTPTGTEYPFLKLSITIRG